MKSQRGGGESISKETHQLTKDNLDNFVILIDNNSLRRVEMSSSGVYAPPLFALPLMPAVRRKIGRGVYRLIRANGNPANAKKAKRVICATSSKHPQSRGVRYVCYMRDLCMIREVHVIYVMCTTCTI